MAERQGRCTNFGNCSKADSKEIISVPSGADFVCPEDGRPLQPVKKPSLGEKIKEWIQSLGKLQRLLLAGVLVICITLIIWKIIPHSAQPDKFLAEVRTSLDDCYRTGEPLTPDKLEQLRKRAENLGVGSTVNELIETAKGNFFKEKRDSFGSSPLPQDLQRLCELASKMGMPTVVPDCKTAPRGDVMALLTQGKFKEAGDLCRGTSNDAQARKLCAEFDTPVTVKASLQYQQSGQAPSPVYSLEAPDLKNLTLTNVDNYRLSASVTQDRAFLYIFQQDQYGDIKRLFPDPVYSGVVNPVEKDKVYQVPAGERDWLYLDVLPPNTDSIPEALHFVASPWEAKDLEQLYGDIHKAMNAADRKAQTEKFLKQLKQRSDPNVKSTFYKEFTFQHGK